MLQLSQSSKHHLKLLLPCSFFSAWCTSAWKGVVVTWYLLPATCLASVHFWSKQPGLFVHALFHTSREQWSRDGFVWHRGPWPWGPRMFDIEDCGHDARDYLRGFAQTRAQVTNGLLWPRSRDPRSSGVREREKKREPHHFHWLMSNLPEVVRILSFSFNLNGFYRKFHATKGVLNSGIGNGFHTRESVDEVCTQVVYRV